MAYFRCSQSGGGNIKSGTTAATSRNTDIVIDTGLSSVSKFVWWAKRTGTYAHIQIVMVDNAIYSNKYNANCLGTSASASNVAFGTQTQNTCMVKSISGGVVTLNTFNSTYCDVQAGVWYAE